MLCDLIIIFIYLFFAFEILLSLELKAVIPVTS
jgi:hypothetical protein